jgi:hypothetical protein
MGAPSKLSVIRNAAALARAKLDAEVKTVFFFPFNVRTKKDNEHGEHDEDNDDAYGEIGANSRWRSAHNEDSNGTGEAYSSNGSRDNNPVHSNYATIAYLLS